MQRYLSFFTEVFYPFQVSFEVVEVDKVRWDKNNTVLSHACFSFFYAVLMNIRYTLAHLMKAHVHLMKALVHLMKALVHLMKALVHLMKALVHLMKALIHLMKALVHLMKALIHLMKALPSLLLRPDSFTKISPFDVSKETNP